PRRDPHAIRSKAMSKDARVGEGHPTQNIENAVGFSYARLRGSEHDHRSSTIGCPWTRWVLAWSRALHALFAVLFGGALAAGFGCAAVEEPAPLNALRQRFPDQAARVLEGSEGFVARERGFSTDDAGDVADALPCRGGLSMTLPASAEDNVLFRV